MVQRASAKQAGGGRPAPAPGSRHLRGPCGDAGDAGALGWRLRVTEDDTAERVLPKGVEGNVAPGPALLLGLGMR